MTAARFISAVCALAAASATLHAAQPSGGGSSSMRMMPGTVKNFELPSFDENTGYKDWELFGSEAQYVNDSQIFVHDMRLDMFDGKKSLKKKAVFSSRSAEVSAAAKTAKSADALLVEGEGFNLKGKNWFWDGAGRSVKMGSDVFVEFTAKRGGEPERLLIASDSALMDYAGGDNRFSFGGRVRVNGDDFKIDCDELETQAPKNSGSADIEALREISARGNVEMSQERASAKAQSARLVPSGGTVALEGSPSVTDSSSGATVSGFKIDFEKGSSTARAYSSPDGKVRAMAAIPEKGGTKTTLISSDEITMTHSDGANVFNFSGGVKVESADFTAFASRLRAVAEESPKDGKYAISKITGSGGVRFLRDGRTAAAEKLEIYPNAGEAWLERSARLSDPERGVDLSSDSIVLMYDKGQAAARSKDGDKNSFVTVRISGAKGYSVAGGSLRPTVVKSRSLDSSWNGGGVRFSFMGDVDISSEDMRAGCRIMDVYAEKETSGAGSSVKKIEAFEDVSVRQKGSEARAEVARIYPKVELQTKGSRMSHRLIEFETSKSAPGIRPKMILPEIGSIGLAEAKADKGRQKTEISSDRQSFVTEKDRDVYVFEGAVEISGTGFEAKCDNIEVSMKPDKSGRRRITHILMTGNLDIRQGGKSAKAGRANIQPEEETIVLSESPLVVNEDGSMASGTKMIYTRGKKSISIENPRVTLPPIGGKK